MPIPKLLVTLALTAAQMALTMTRTIEGPRLDDLKGSTAGYGTPHPNGLGLVKTAAPAFFCEPIKEKKKKRKTKGGKYKEYTYFGTWASMVAGHEIRRVRRIWFDKHLVYDATGGAINSVGDDADTVETLDNRATTLADLIRIYLGTEDQEPDPRMLATVEDNEGPGTCPAYKGIAYIFFEDVPLEKVGNRFPQVDVEFQGIGDGSFFVAGSFDDHDLLGGHNATSTPSFSGDVGPYQWFRFSPSGTYGCAQSFEFNGQRTMAWASSLATPNITETDFTTVTMPGQPFAQDIDRCVIDDAGNLYVEEGHFRQVAATGHRGTYQVPSLGAGTPVQLGSNNDIETRSLLDAAVTVGAETYLVYRHRTVLADHKIWIRPVSTGVAQEKFSDDDGQQISDNGIVKDSYGDVWGWGLNWDLFLGDYGAAGEGPVFNSIWMWKIIDGGARPETGVQVQITGLPDMDWDNDSFADWSNQNAVAHWDGYYVFHTKFGRLDLVDDTTFAYVSSIDLASLVGVVSPPQLLNNNHDLKDIYDPVTGRLYVVSYSAFNSAPDVFAYTAETVHVVSFPAGELLASIPVADWNVPVDRFAEKLIYSPALDRLIGFEISTRDSSTTTFDYPEHMVFMTVEPGVALTLGGVIRHFSGLVGHVEGTDYSIHASVDAIEVDGLLWTQGQAKQGFDWLIDIYDVIARPHDGVTQFIARGVASSFALTTPEFVIERGQPENRYKLTVSNDTDMPAEVTFNFADLGNDLEPNNVTSMRDEQATDATGKLTIDGTTLTLETDNAQQMVDRYFRSKWFRRAKSENRVSSERLAIEPGDVGTIDFDGLTLKVEVEKARHSADGSIHLECLQYDQALAGLSEGVGSPAMGRPNSEIFSPGASVGFVLDIPMPNDTYDQAAPFVIVAGGPENADDQYIGTDFHHSDTGDADTFDAGWAGTGSGDPVTYGTVATPIGASEPWIIDNASVIGVVLVDGTLSSVTEDQMLNNASLNLFAYGAPGRWMLGQFKTATLTAPLTYDVSGLILGSRGTEQYIGTQEAGDRFILLDSAIALRTVGADEIGDTDYYIPAAPGTTPDTADVIELEFDANAHRPYSPVHGTLTLSGSDWEIDAVRRTRIGGSTVNGQDVPLGETSESWEADIYDGPTFKRTITGTSLPLLWTAAMQTTDFGAPVTSGFEVNLYQMNPTLLIRGFPLALAA